jgi:beta-carotene 3-hydroxylase
MNLWSIFIVLGTVVGMEGVAYATHRWIMHGRLGWGWHKSHHESDHHGVFEKNDLYAIVFLVLSIGLFMLGDAWWPGLWLVALGMTIYGFIYFVPRGGYARRLYQAHKLHHAVEGREDCVSFGFVYAPPVEKLKHELRASGVLENRRSRHRDAWNPERDGA